MEVVFPGSWAVSAQPLDLEGVQGRREGGRKGEEGRGGGGGGRQGERCSYSIKESVSTNSFLLYV